MSIEKNVIPLLVLNTALYGQQTKKVLSMQTYVIHSSSTLRSWASFSSYFNLLLTK